jgi:hypothetical protein
MKNLLDFITRLIKGISKTALIIICSVIILFVGACTMLHFMNKSNSISIETDNHIDITPTQIRYIEAIGEWEFLSISDEELIDTVRHGFFGDDELVRIYYGTLRFGINLHKAKPGWIKSENNVIKVSLPPIELLDEDFIDEAKTRSFYENGKWKEKDKADLYHRAYLTMRSRCFTKTNIATAEQNAGNQFKQLLNAMGFENTTITFDNSNK